MDKPGPSTVLTNEEEEQLSSYHIETADMGVGLSRDAVMDMAFMNGDRSQRKYPSFYKRQADHAWFKGF